MILLWWFIIGILAGTVARAIVPGRDRLTIGQTFGLGLAGSFVGGLLVNLVGSGSLLRLRRTGLLGSIVGAVVLLVLIRVVRGGGEPSGG